MILRIKLLPLEGWRIKLFDSKDEDAVEAQEYDESNVVGAQWEEGDISYCGFVHLHRV